MYKIEDVYFYHGFVIKRQLPLKNKWGCWAYYRSGRYYYNAPFIYLNTLRECKDFIDNVHCSCDELKYKYVEDIMCPIYKEVEPSEFTIVKRVKCKCFEIVRT